MQHKRWNYYWKKNTFIGNFRKRDYNYPNKVRKCYPRNNFVNKRHRCCKQHNDHDDTSFLDVQQIERKQESSERKKIDLCKRDNTRLGDRTKVKAHFNGLPRNLYIWRNSNRRQHSNSFVYRGYEAKFNKKKW